MDRVQTKTEGHILVIQMNRPDKRNAVDAEMTAGLDAALNRLDDDPELWCGVLTGGPDMFCAGTDLKSGPGTPTERGGNYGVVKRQRRTPLIAAVDGIAYGGGFEIVLSCDLVVAGRSARFALPEVSRGVLANCGALFRTQRPLSLNIAKQMLLTGQPLAAPRAYDLGLVSELTDDGQALDGALHLAEQICKNSPYAVGVTLQAVDRVAGMSDDEGWAATADALALILASEDRREGVDAFLEKREPRWVGR